MSPVVRGVAARAGADTDRCETLTATGGGATGLSATASSALAKLVRTT